MSSNKLDYDILRQEIRSMKPNDKLHRLLKSELSKIPWFFINNLTALREIIRNMKLHQPVYKIFKEEFTKKGYWRLRARGNPKAGFKKGWGKHKNEE